MRTLLALAALVAAAPNVNRLILQPAQVGKGYVLIQRSDGQGVHATVTLYLCGRTGYASETLRTARLQVNYLKSRTLLGLSNEIVSYKRGGSIQAMREVTQHALTCPKHAIDTGQAGLPPLRFTIT